MTNLSRADKQMISELEAAHERMFSGRPSPLLSNLRNKLQSITRNIYVFDHIPEQGEDLYRVLVDGTTVVHIEIPRDERSGEVIFEKWNVKDYLHINRKVLGKILCRKFKIALRLAESRATQANHDHLPV